MSGRISVRINDRIDAGQIRWERDAVRGVERVALLSPLGTQVAELTRAGRHAEFRRGETRLSGEMEALTESLMGVALDLGAMAGWLQGAGLDAEGRGTVDSSDGRRWTLLAEGFHTAGLAVVARRLTVSSGDTVLRLVVDEWVVK
ncbi:MAG: hypothetical protein JNK75_07995 [Betaproteobacteria bacterium]|nr:hypothetical protein [Betaproteobacteria bacterium]